MRIYVLILSLCWVFGACGNHQDAQVTAPRMAEIDEAQVDSIIWAFETQADEFPELYLHNPDSFLNSIQVTPQTSFQKTAYANGMIFMAYTLREKGNNFDSIRLYERVLRYIEENDGVNIDRYTFVIRPLSNLYIRIGDNNRAIQLLEDVIPRVGDWEEKNSLTIALANSYLFYGNVAKSQKLLYRVVRGTESPASRALAYNTLASAYLRGADTAGSIHYNRLALQEFEDQELRGRYVIPYTSALALCGELVQQNHFINQAVTILEKHFPLSQQRVKARYVMASGEIYQAKNQYEAAQIQYRETLQLLASEQEHYVRDYTYTRALFGMAYCHEHRNHIDSALHYYQWAIENDFRTQQLIAGKEDQLRNNLWHRGKVERMVNLIAGQLTSPNADSQNLTELLLWCIELSKARLLINEINRSEQWEASTSEVRDAVYQIRDLYVQYDQHTDWTEKQVIQARIDKLLLDFRLSEKYFEALDFEPDQEIFLSHLKRAGTDYYSYFVHQDKQVSVVSKVGQVYHYDRITDTAFMGEVGRVKNTYFGDDPKAYRDNPAEYRERTKQIARKLLPNKSHSGTYIYASLDGDLYGLPLDALWDDDFLVVDYQVAYLNSFLLFNFMPLGQPADHRIALLYRSEYEDPLPDLNFVQQEVQRISGLFRTRQVPPPQQRDIVLSEIFADSNIVHIAAHTVIDTSDQAPLLYLEQVISTNQIRFYQMNTPLVFLSACNTGSGSALPAEGTESVQRMFLSKGVPSVISTYWFANDEVMLRLTTGFYKHLARIKQPMEALAETKREYLARANGEQQNPWYWANINYTGVGNAIGLEKTPNLSRFIYLLLMPLVGGVVYFLWKRRRSPIE